MNDTAASFAWKFCFLVANLQELDFKDGHFDRVFSMEALYYSPDLDTAIKEAHRVLKPEGICDVVINCFQEHELSGSWPELMGVEMNYLAETEWKSRFEAAGFASVATSRVIDSRGPGDEASFEASKWCPDWASKVASHEAGSLWIHGRK